MTECVMGADISFHIPRCSSDVDVDTLSPVSKGAASGCDHKETEYLETVFEGMMPFPYLTRRLTRRLADELGWDLGRITRWFINRRRRKDTAASIPGMIKTFDPKRTFEVPSFRSPGRRLNLFFARSKYFKLMLMTTVDKDIRYRVDIMPEPGSKSNYSGGRRASASSQMATRTMTRLRQKQRASSASPLGLDFDCERETEVTFVPEPERASPGVTHSQPQWDVGRLTADQFDAIVQHIDMRTSQMFSAAPLGTTALCEEDPWTPFRDEDMVPKLRIPGCGMLCCTRVPILEL